MSFNTGNGGTLTVSAATLHVSKWTHNRQSRLTENTNSSSAGSSNYEHVVYDHSWTAEGPLDDENLPDVDAGLNPGPSKATVTFKEGGSSKTLVLTNTSVEVLEIIDDNTSDIMRWRASGKGGVLTNHST